MSLRQLRQAAYYVQGNFWGYRLARAISVDLGKGCGLVDVGANIGYFSTGFARACNVRDHVCFEPDLENFAYLESNLRRWNISAKTIPLGLGSRSRIARLSMPLYVESLSEARRANSGYLSFFGREFVDQSCRLSPITSFDDISLDLGLNDELVYFIKIDTEGYEYEVLEGAKTTLAAFPTMVIILEINPVTQKLAEYSLADVFALLTSCGFGFLYSRVCDDVLPDETGFSASSGNVFITQHRLGSLVCSEYDLVETAL